MDLTRLGALAASGAGGASLATGSVFSGSGVSLMSVEGPTHRSVSVPPGKHFQNVDLSCVQEFYLFSRGGIFPYLRDTDKIRAQTSGLTYPAYKLEAPTSITGTTKGCLRTTFSQIEEAGNKKKTVGVSMEMAMSRDDHYGIILMNNISNIKDQTQGITSLFRAIFLEKKDRQWEIKGGIEWTDEALTNQIKDSTKKLKWTGLAGRTEEINLENPYEDSQNIKKDSFSLSWVRDNGKPKNMFQELTVMADPSAQPKPTQDFWNGEAEPFDTNSKAFKNPSAVFVNGVWAKHSGEADVKAKEWIKLFNQAKGSWQ